MFYCFPDLILKLAEYGKHILEKPDYKIVKIRGLGTELEDINAHEKCY